MPRPQDEAYQPPQDGRLTPKQVEQFLAVAAKVRTIQKGAPAGPSPVDQPPVDLTAAREVPFNVNEYLWVKERILEAEGALLAQKLRADHIALLEKTLADLRRRRAEAPDEGSKKLLAEQAANFEDELSRTRRETREKEPESIRENLKVIHPFRGRLNALQGELSRMVPPK